MRNKIITICSMALLALSACEEDDNNGTNNGTTAGTNNGTTNNGTTGGSNNGTTNNGTNIGTTGGTTNNGTTNNGTTGGTTAGTTGAGDSPMCIQYCKDAIATCTGANELYTDEAMCLTACEGLVDNTTDCSADPASCEKTGDSVQCRLYHLSAAAGDADLHCGHAAVLSKDDVCGTK